MSSSLHTSGRGGAGNMTDGKATPVQPEDLQTPILKSNVVSTGRGGSGNIAANLNEEERRRRQDVTPVERGPHGAFNTGRGGAGNVVMEDKVPSPTDEKLEKVTSTSIGRSPSPKTDKPEGKQSILGKAKNLFGKKDQQ